MPEPDCFLRYHISAGMQNFTSGKSDVYVLAAAAMHGFTMVLFTEAVSHQNTFVGGTCAPPSALLVFTVFQVEEDEEHCTVDGSERQTNDKHDTSVTEQVVSNVLIVAVYYM